MRFGWIGFHVEGLPALEALLERRELAAVVSLTGEAAAKRSGAADYARLCSRYDVPLHVVDDINAETSVALLQRLALDVTFVIGWSQILRPAALRTARVGMIGAHASLLPRNRGSAPINWSLINGEDVTGNTLIWLTEGVDAGQIIDQTEFPIGAYDTCASLYHQVARSNRDMILRILPQLREGQRPGRPQPHSDEPVLARRRPRDGVIAWQKEARAVYDFVRALTRPYPGAFGRLAGREWRVWQAALLPSMGEAVAPPGTVLGAVVSPVDGACGQAVACGRGAVVLLEVESDSGEVLRGRRLSDEPWQGKQWSHE